MSAAAVLNAAPLPNHIHVNAFHEALWRGDERAIRSLMAPASSGGSGGVPVPAVVEVLLASEHPAPHGRLRRPLMVAADSGNVALATLLLAAGAPPNQANSLGVTALFVAAQEGHEGVVRLLIERGASVHAARAGDSATAIVLSAQHGHDSCVTLLVAAGADVNVATGDCGVTPLYTSTFMHQLSTVKLLIAAGAELGKMTTGDSPTKPLYLAAWKDFRDVGRVLVARGATLSDAERASLAAGLRPDVWHIWRTILDGSAISLVERDEIHSDIAQARRLLDGARGNYQWHMLRPSLFQICLGLEHMDLPALVTYAIFEQLNEDAHMVPMHRAWTLITAVKHLLHHEAKELRRSQMLDESWGADDDD